MVIREDHLGVLELPPKALGDNSNEKTSPKYLY